ncbi:MAG: hypothetical protein LUG85_01370 [Clostridiales bacterium]|nr:hypothetical protein [Clostridiales bacterium]
METGLQSFYDTVNNFVDFILKLVNGFLALFGIDLSSLTGSDDDTAAEETTQA